MAEVERVRQLLAATSVPAEVAASWLDEAPALWLTGEASAELLASDLALCHPTLGAGEVRARALPIDYSGGWRLTVVAPDRPGLMADTAGVLAEERLSVSSASALTWTGTGIALHSITMAAAELEPERWQDIGRRIRAAAGIGGPDVAFEPSGAAHVSATGADEEVGGSPRSLLTVTAPDQIGLLWAICRTLADQRVSIEVAQVGGEGGTARDLFVTTGAVDVADLAARLSVTGRSRLARAASGIAGSVPLVGPVLRRGVEAVM